MCVFPNFMGIIHVIVSDKRKSDHVQIILCELFDVHVQVIENGCSI